MKKSIIVILIGMSQIFAQTYNPTIANILNQVSLDTLVKHVRILSGEDSLYLDGRAYLIRTRDVNPPRLPETEGHRLAAKYIVQTLKKYDLEAFEQKFPVHIYSTNTYDTLRNVIGIKLGQKYPEKKIIFSAHYDCTVLDGDGSIAPGADDNGSGVGIVLEAARLLSKYNTDYTIYYTFWDWTETDGRADLWFIGDTNRTDLLAAIDLESLGYDGDSLNTTTIFYYSDFNIPLCMKIVQINELYQIGLKVDTSAFAGCGTILNLFHYQLCPTVHIEHSIKGHNPYCWSLRDTVGAFNLDYYLKNAKLAIATLADLAFNGLALTANKNDVLIPSGFYLLNNFPNPFNAITTIRFHLPRQTSATLSVFDLNGNLVWRRNFALRERGLNSVQFDGSTFSSGIYFYQVGTLFGSLTGKMLLLK